MKHTLVVVIGLAVCAWSARGQAPVPNDLCQNATPVFDGVNPGAPLGAAGSFFSNIGAGTEGFASCIPAGYGSFSDVWFSYTATSSGIAIISTCTPPGFAPGSLWGTALSVHASCAGPDIACAGFGASCGVGLAKLPVLVTTGSSYVIRVAGIGGGRGTFYLTIEPPGPPPANDACASAIQVFDGVNPPTGAFDNVNATPDGSSPCTANPGIERDVWFRYTATATGTRAVSTCTPAGYVGGMMHASLAVFGSCGGAPLGCNASGLCPIVSFPTTLGATYIIRVAGQHTDECVPGTFFLTIVAPASNDECSNPVPLTPGLNGPFSSIASTASAGTFCLGQPNATDLWYAFTTGPCPGAYTVETCPFPTLPSIHAACGGPPIACAIAYPPSPCGGAEVTFTAAASTTYLVRVSSPAASPDLYTINVIQGGVMTLGYVSPGPGCVMAGLSGAPPAGLYFLAVTLTAGTFPLGSFYGIDIRTTELASEFSIGYPFAGPADSCGNALLGPFCGLPSGVTFYSVAFGFAVAYSFTPASVSAPVSYMIP